MQEKRGAGKHRRLLLGGLAEQAPKSTLGALKKKGSQFEDKRMGVEGEDQD